MQDKKKLQSVNPYTGQVRKKFQFATQDQLDKIIKKAEKGLQVQKKRTLQQRAKIVANMAKIFKQHRDQLAKLICVQMGKPIAQAQGEVDKTIAFFQYYSSHYDPLKPKKLQQTDAKIKAQIVYKPLGIIYMMVPFNFPLQSGWKGGIATLLAGNCILVKTSSVCPQLAQLIEQLTMQAGFDQGQYQCIHAPHQMIDKILQYDSVAGISFIGSTKAGADIASKAGKHLKKTVMQLGGNDPFIVLADADLDLAIKKAVQARTRNCGQVCNSPKRFIIEEPLYDVFKNRLIDQLKKVKYGDPMDRDTQLGPLAKQNLHKLLNKQLQEMPKSYRILWRREGIQKPFFPITVIQGSQQEYDEQMFGPTFTLYKAKDQKHAIELANKGGYGLGGQVFSKNRGQQVIDQVRCGMGFVNQVSKSDYLFPFGGVGKSGYGRECGQEAFKEFTNIKVHYIC